MELESLLSLEDITGVEVARNLVVFLNSAAFFKGFNVSSRKWARFDIYDMAAVCCKIYIDETIYDSQIWV